MAEFDDQDTVDPNEELEALRSEEAKWGGFGLDSDGATRLPGTIIKTMKPEYRMVAILKAMAITNKDIAKQTGYSQGHVATILAQPAIKKLVLDAQNRMGVAGFKARLNDMSGDALEALGVIVKSPFATAGERLNAAKYILDQTIGKAVNYTDIAENKPNPFKESQNVEDRIRDVTERLKRSGVNPAVLTGGDGEASTD